MYDGDHTAYGMEGTGATGEDTVHNVQRIRPGEVGYLLSQDGIMQCKQTHFSKRIESLSQT